jgi:hypothetical protein
MEREAILVTDTDSFFLYFKPLIETLFEYKNKTSLLDSFEKEDVKYTLNYLNCYIYIISTFIEYILYDYTTRNNMRDSEKSILNMKNEFVFLSIILTAGKKNYVGARVQREGHFVFPPKVSVTGIPFKKKNVPYKTTKVMNALASKILDFKQLFVVLRELRDFKEYIKKSILTSVEYFPLKSLKPYYKAPLTQEVFRGALLWNELYPEEEIKNNDECFMVKLDPDKIDEILKEQDPENQIFQAYINIEKTYQDFSKTNPVLALPLSKLNVPEEFVDLILSESIIDLNLNTFSPILKSFNVHLGGSSKNRPTSILKIQ